MTGWIMLREDYPEAKAWLVYSWCFTHASIRRKKRASGLGQTVA